SLGARALMVAPLVWVTTELGRTHLFTGFPWVLLGYSQVTMLPIAQLASVFGVYGVSALVASVSAAAALVVAGRVGPVAPVAAAAGAGADPARVRSDRTWPARQVLQFRLPRPRRRVDRRRLSQDAPRAVWRVRAAQAVVFLRGAACRSGRGFLAGSAGSAAPSRRASD